MCVMHIPLLPTVPGTCLQSWSDDGLEPTQESGTRAQDCGPPALSPPFPLSSPPLGSPSGTGCWGNWSLKKGGIQGDGNWFREEGLKGRKVKVSSGQEKTRGRGGGVQSSGMCFALLLLMMMMMMVIQ